MIEGAKLTLSGIRLPGDTDPLGVWELGSRRESVAFASGARFDGLAWRVDFPAAGPEAASQMNDALRIQLDEVIRLERQLDAVDVQIARLDLMPAYGAVLSAQEAELLRAVNELSQPPAALDMDADEDLDYRRIYAQCEGLLAQFRALVRPVARVETVVGGRSVALTAIDWNGDHRTAWVDGVGAGEMATHVEAVRLAMASRQTLLRLCVIVVTGALELALKAHIPGGQILLLPAVYRFVRDVLQEVERLRDGNAVR